MKRTMQCLQDQLELLTMEAQQDYTTLHSATTALQTPAQNLQQSFTR